MKELNKNKKVVIITVAVLVIIAIVVAVVFATQKNSGSSGDASSDTPSPVYETVVDEKGNVVTKTDENGEPITKADKNGNPVYEKTTGKDKTSSSDTTKKGQSGKDTSTKPTSEKEQTSQYTTMPADQPIVTPDIPLDEYALTASLAFYNLQSYYDSYYDEKYIVNYDTPNNKDSDNISFAVFVKDEKVKTKIEYHVMVNLLKGTYTQTDSKGKSKNITKAVNTPKEQGDNNGK